MSTPYVESGLARMADERESGTVAIGGSLGDLGGIGLVKLING